MPRLTLEMEIDSDSDHAGEQLNDAILLLSGLRERFWTGEAVKNQSDLILDSVDDDELLGNYRID